MNKLIYQLFLVFIIVSSSTTSFAQEIDSTSTEKNYYKHAVGMTFTSASGLGMSYRYRIKNSFGFQISYLPVIETIRGRENNHVFGFSFIYTFYEGEKSNFYIYQGNSYWISQEVGGGYYAYHTNNGAIHTNPNYYEEYNYYKKFMNNSLGLGMEFLIQERGGVNIQVGLGGYDNFTSILPAGGISLYYKL